MSTRRILDDFARLASDAAGVAQGARREVESVARAQIERLLRDMDVATREEVEVLRDLLATQREEIDRLRTRLEVVEASAGTPDRTV